MENNNNNTNNQDLDSILHGLNEIVTEMEEKVEQDTIDSIFSDVYASFENVKVPTVPKQECKEDAAPVQEVKAEKEPDVPVESEPDTAEEDNSEAVAQETEQKEYSSVEENIEEEEEEVTVQPQKKKNIWLFLLVSLLLLIIVGAVYLKNTPSKKATSPEEIVEPEEIQNPMDPVLRKMWLDNKNINEDYVGEIIFESGLIQESVVQAKNVYKPDGTEYVIYDEYGNLATDTSYLSGNDVYIWTNWKTGEPVDRNTGIGGSTFLDFRNELSEKMLIVYGHHWARDYMEQHGIEGEPNFTALDKFEDKENYEINRRFSFILDNEIREYTVCAVYTIDVGDEKDIEPLAMGKFSEESLEHVKQLMLYGTDVEMNVDDDYMMLVTCKQHDPMHREIVLAKETGREKY